MSNQTPQNPVMLFAPASTYDTICMLEDENNLTGTNFADNRPYVLPPVLRFGSTCMELLRASRTSCPSFSRNPRSLRTLGLDRRTSMARIGNSLVFQGTY
jgi:hypothetical protein